MTAAPLDLGRVQFYWRTTANACGTGPAIPAFLPFVFDFDPSLQLVIQKRNSLVLEMLERVYREDANVGYVQQRH